MNRKKIIALTLAASLSASLVPANLTFAQDNKDTAISANVRANEVKVSKFTLNSVENYGEYEKAFKVNVKLYSNNGGNYSSSTLNKAFDGNVSTHWETGKANSTSFTNEIIVTFENVEAINRIVYAARQDASNKGYATKFSIYASETEDGDFELVGKGNASRTADLTELKFATVEAKKIKFVFEEAYNSWASASELMFFKEDSISDKMERLFTDDTLSKVSEEFNTIEKITALDEEVKNHPLYNKFKENIENAKSLIGKISVDYSAAKVSTFIKKDSELLAKYNEVYRVPDSKITSITTNGSQYGANSIEKAMDGDFNTGWHSGKQNSSNFTNEVVITLNELTRINRLVYTGNQGTYRGFAEAFDIYASTTTKGDTFELITSGTAARTKDSLEIEFNPTEVRRVKFVFKQGYENWALASEFGLYTEDGLGDKVNSVFTNGLMNELNEEYNTLEEIEKLAIEVNAHPLKSEYESTISLAKELLENSEVVNTSRIVTGEQRGHYTTVSGLRMINGAAYSSFESFGKYVTAGEKIVVYVDADPNGKLPQLCFGQVGTGKGDWRRWVSLKPGKNEITVPQNINPSALYLVNQASASEQEFAPRVRIEGGQDFPTYFHGETDPQEFRAELEAFAKKVNTDDTAFENGHPEDSVYNIAEFVSENVVITTSALGALKGLEAAEKQNLDISDTMNDWEEMYDMFQTFMGFEKDTDDEKNSYFPNKFVARVFQNVPLGFADHGYTGYLGSKNAERDGAFFSMIAMPPTMKENDNWCYTHEFGHIFNTKYIVDGEVTNNLFAQEYRRINADKGINANRANWNEILKRFKGEDNAMHYFERLAVLSQINIAYGYDSYGKASRAVRENTELFKSIKGTETQRLAVAYSLGLGVDLLDFFEGWKYNNIEITEQMREVVKDLPKPDKKIEYLHGAAYDYEGTGFAENNVVEVKNNINESENTVTLTFSIDKENEDDVLGYEILQDGEVIGYTKENSFVIKNVDTNKNQSYKVVPYAKDLTVGNSTTVNTFTPNLSVQQDSIILGLNSEFNAKDLVKGFTYSGQDISEEIVIDSNVDTSKKGSYIINYELTDNKIKVEKTINVEVVSGYDYLSDYEWKSTETAYGTPRRNSSIKGRVNGEIRAFEKGFGIHANGRIVYDLSELNYDTFEALLGVDMTIAAQNNSSIKFNIIGDGNVLASTKTIKHADDMVAVSVPVTGVKELVIEVKDAGNGNTSDHAVIVNPKLSTNNMKPVINTKNENVIKLGTEFDIMAGVTAFDVEDGDLTSNIEVISNTYESGKVGKFKVVYQVTDSDSNVTEKTSYVTVYEEITATKSKFAYLNNLEEYNESFKVPVVSVSNNGGNYGSSAIKYSIDNNRGTHWETGKPNSTSFQNEVIFDLGENTEIDKMTYAARSGGKGFATKFEVYISNEAEGNDFRLATTGSYSGSVNDVIEIDIDNTEARRVKFKFVEANQDWASIGEMTFYSNDDIEDKIANNLFTDASKTAVSESYNTLEKLDALRAKVNAYPAGSMFQDDLNKAEEIIRASFPSITASKAITTKLGVEIDLVGEYSATDKEDGDITSNVEITNNVNFNKTGKYAVTYTVTDSHGNISTAERIVYVTDMESYSYLSDIAWKSTSTSYTAVRKDVGISGNKLRLTAENGKEVSYEKGLGVHSTSTIVYDLTKGDYTNFSSYIGVDRQMYNSIGSVSFEIYLDGVNVYNSKLMNAKDQQKFIDLDVTGAKEMKIIVTDGGNGNGSDHAVLGDAKLYYVDLNGIEVNRANLDELMNTASKLNEEVYSTETWTNLQNVLAEVKKSLKDGYNQSEIDSLYNKLNEAYTSLVQIVDLNEVVNISDTELKRLVKESLALASNNITIGDMYKLTSLKSQGTLISSLEGLQYAKNLESIAIEYNEIADLSPLKDLSKLTDVKITEGYVVVGYPSEVNGKVIIDETRIDITGERLKPTEIKVGNKSDVKYINVEEALENGVIYINKDELNSGVNSIVVSYEGANGAFQSQSIYMFMK